VMCMRSKGPRPRPWVPWPRRDWDVCLLVQPQLRLNAIIFKYH